MENEDKNKSFTKENKKKLFSFDVILTLILMIILALGIINFLVSDIIYPKKEINLEALRQNQPGLNEIQLKNKDPYITRNPNLPDMLTGPIINPNDPVIGDKYAKLNIFLFSDFSCSFCSVQEQEVKKLLAEHKNDVRLFWKDFPDTEPSSESFLAAIAGQCAQSQGKFWPYHDLLFEFNNNLNEDKFFELADLLKLNKDEFRDCYNNKSPMEGINKDIEEANMLEISGVPFMYVGTQEIMGEISYEELERLVELELSSK